MFTYEWWWYHTEFWLKPEDRRPYTFILRDLIYKHPLLTIALSVWFGVWIKPYLTPEIVLCFLCGMLTAHLCWGSEYIPNQQEDPPYLGEDV